MPFVLKLVCLCLLICLSGCERSSNAGCHSLDDGYSGFDATEIGGFQPLAQGKFRLFGFAKSIRVGPRTRTEEIASTH